MKKVKRILAMVLTVAALLTLVACGEKKDPNTDNKDGDKSKFKCAFLIPGPITDMSWCYNEFRGYEKVVEAGYEATYQENVSADMLVESVRTYAGEGYNCIIIGTDANQEDVIETAKDFPNCQIFIANCAYVTDNVYPIFFADEDQGFAMGVVAGLATKTNKVAYIAGIDFAPLVNGGKGFEAGVKYVNPDCEVLRTIAGTTEDVGMLKETAKELFKSGYDVIAPNADQAGLGVMEAANEVDGAMAIAGGDGMVSVAPTKTICAVNMHTYVGYYAAFMDFVNGTIPKQASKYGMAAGLVELPAWNDQFTSPLSADQIAKVEAAYKAYGNGEIKVDLG